MNKDLLKINIAFNPDKAAKNNVYYNCSEARGNNVIFDEIKNQIILANASMIDTGDAGIDLNDASDYQTFLFSGHSGCGKSSELLQLNGELKKYSEDFRFYPVFIDANEYLNKFDVKITSILLAIITEVSEVLRNDKDINIEGTYFSNLWQRIKTEAESEWKIEGFNVNVPYGLPSAQIKRLAGDDSARKKIHNFLKDDTFALLQEINSMLSEARKKVKNLEAHGKSEYYQDIVIIFDNLEKIEKFDTENVGFDSAKKLFIEYSGQLKGIKSHIVYTAPIELMRSSHAQALRNLYSGSFVLPMVKIFKRDGVTEYEKGTKALKNLVQARLENLELSEVFNDDAIDLLIHFSGGHIRTLIRLVKYTANSSKSLPLSYDDADYAVSKEYESISPQFFDSDAWRLLAKLHLKSEEIVGEAEEKCMKMLADLHLYEYLNGDDDNDEVGAKNNRNRQTPWYATDPFLRELEQFKNALADLDKPLEDEKQLG
jgi:energy-coupling factor transporter ATP-binding protein EcfA2